MERAYDKVPESGLLDPTNFDSHEDWRSAQIDRAEALAEAFISTLSEHEEPEELAYALNQLLAPFNVYENDGEPQNHLVALTGLGTETHGRTDVVEVQTHGWELDTRNPLVAIPVVRHEDGFWWVDGWEEPESSSVERLHEDVALTCLHLVWWGNVDEISSTPSAETLETWRQKAIAENDDE